MYIFFPVLLVIRRELHSFSHDRNFIYPLKCKPSSKRFIFIKLILFIKIQCWFWIKFALSKQFKYISYLFPKLFLLIDCLSFSYQSDTSSIDASDSFLLNEVVAKLSPFILVTFLDVLIIICKFSHIILNICYEIIFIFLIMLIIYLFCFPKKLFYFIIVSFYPMPHF